LGQNFLTDGIVLHEIIQAANLEPGMRVIEIGPGIGVLTQALIEAQAAVTAFELDQTYVHVIQEDFPGVTVIQGDSIATLPEYVRQQTEPYLVVANIPYQITTPLLQVLFESGDAVLLQRAVLLIQYEVAQRLAAAPKTSDRSFLSVLIQLHADVELVVKVPPTAFTPAPTVNSAVIRLTPKTHPGLPIDPVEKARVIRFIKLGFKERRKQLKNVLAAMRGVPESEIRLLLRGLGFSEMIRAQELSVDEWLTLYKAMH
jgi:16S rRNA (adenine1518-N6/adenine1519-N6)-dimethyltransferase